MFCVLACYINFFEPCFGDRYDALCRTHGDGDRCDTFKWFVVFCCTPLRLAIFLGWPVDNG